MMNPKCYTKYYSGIILKHSLTTGLKYSRCQLQVGDLDSDISIETIGCLHPQQLPPPIAAIQPI